MFAFAEEVHRSQFELCSPVNPIGGLFDFARFLDLESGHVELEHYKIASNDFIDGIGIHVTFGSKNFGGIKALLERSYLWVVVSMHSVMVSVTDYA